MTPPKRLAYLCLTFACASVPPAGAQVARASRLRSSISSRTTVELPQHINRLARAAVDQGAVAASMSLPGLTLNFKPTPAQQAALDALLADQQNPASPHYRQWLTPEEFGNRFGLSQSDYDQVADWLTAEGFTVAPATRGRRWIGFQGTAAQVEKTFGTPIHQYVVDGERHYANAANPKIPAALAGMVLNLHGLHDFRKKARARQVAKQPNINLVDGSHALAPDDFATIYNVGPLYAAGFDGTGQSIVVVGQSNVRATDQAGFRTRFNLPAQSLRTVLVPGERNPGVVAGDVDEANLDIQWAGAVARGANIIFVYANNVDTSTQYAIDQNLAPVLSMSYGICEMYDLVDLPAERALAQQANAQGITWLAASGDVGATDCEDRGGNLAQTGLSVDTPASIPEVTGLGGTGFEGLPGVQYWSTSNASNGASALTYIPEVAWNETLTEGEFSSGGGGTSVIFPKPAWQAGTGVPSSAYRHVPDLALNSSGGTPYPVYSQGSIGYFYGTSAATPAMAGLVAILNQYVVSKGVQKQAGLGNINPGLYRLAQNARNVFHDVTRGSNAQPCAAGSQDCSAGTAGFAAGEGYDRATGLGSLDANAFVAAWSNSPPTVSMVVPSIDQTPVFQGPSIADSPTPNATSNWVFTLTLTEEAGIGTTLTGFSINGTPGDLSRFSATTIPARGSVRAENLVLTPAQVTAPATVLFNFTGVDANGQTWSRDLAVPFQTPQVKMRVAGTINAASGQQTYAPGMLISIFGTQFGSSTQSASAIPLPSILAGFEAFIDGNLAPLYFVSPGQVNVQIPYETSAGTVKMFVGNPYDSSEAVSLQIAPTAPGIFAANGALVPFPIVARGSTSTLFITGEGKVSPALATGTTPATTVPVGNLPKPTAAGRSVTVGGRTATIAFIGIPPGLVGVTQINYVMPPDAPLGVQPVVVTIGAAASPPVNVTVTQ